MKVLLNKIKLFVITFAFLGASGAGMTALVNEPVLAAESTVRKTGAETGYSIPNEITIKKGETKTITLNVPKGSTDVTNVAWGYQTNSCFSYIESKPGSYWGKKAYITIKGTRAGTGYINTQTRIFKTKGKSDSYKYTAYDKCVVKVVDGTVKQDTKKPLQSISLSKTSLSLKAGESAMLNYTKKPADTTEKGSVSWSSNNTAVATVSGGKVVAKKAGTATITAKLGTKTATCKVTVSAAAAKKTTSASSTASAKESYKNVSEAYTLTNQFRTTRSNQWYWNANNKTKTYTYGLKSLTRDVALENIAKQRAKEQWTQYYVNGRSTHIRPNGKAWTTAYPASVKVLGENLSFGRTTCRDVILNGWAETDKKYEKQGHRRNMLNTQAKRVGIACYEKNGKTCWAMSLGW